MELTEHFIPSQVEKQSWNGSTKFTLTGADTLKIESDGVEHLDLNVPEGETYEVEITLRIVKVYNG
jgi:hypothetical protein